MTAHEIKRILYARGALDVLRVYESIKLAVYSGRDLEDVLREFKKNQPALFGRRTTQ